MSPTSARQMPCAVFGHNYYSANKKSDPSTELVCSHCGTLTQPDALGNFEDAPLANKAIQSTLRHLFHLHLRRPRSISG